MAVEDALRRIITNGEILHKWLHGSDITLVQTDGGDIPTIANLAKRASAQLEISLIATSTSQVVVGLGPKTFTIQTNKGFKVGQWLVIATAGASMLGQVVNYANTSLNVNVEVVQGTGTFSTWSIAMTGKPGTAGKDGDPGDDGKDAYEVAVQTTGYSGTRAQWVASLKGAPGKDGDGARPRMIVKMPWEA